MAKSLVSCFFDSRCSALAQRRTGKKPSVRSTETHQPRWTTDLVKPWAGNRWFGSGKSVGCVAG